MDDDNVSSTWPNTATQHLTQYDKYKRNCNYIFSLYTKCIIKIDKKRKEGKCAIRWFL